MSINGDIAILVFPLFVGVTGIKLDTPREIEIVGAEELLQIA
jgi:hypothetical protein